MRKEREPLKISDVAALGERMVDGPLTLEKRALLAGLPLLGRLAPAELDRLAAFAHFRNAEAGETLFRRGDPGSFMLTIISGRIKIGVESPDGREVVLAILGAGDILGEMALLDGRPRSADATALEPSRLLVLNRREFLPFLERNPAVCIGLLGILCERLRRTSVVLQDRVLLNLPARLAKTLLDLAGAATGSPQAGTRIDYRMAQRTLAALLGTSRESLNKQLHAWEEAGLIRLGRGYVILNRPDELARLVKIV